MAQRSKRILIEVTGFNGTIQSPERRKLLFAEMAEIVRKQKESAKAENAMRSKEVAIYFIGRDCWRCRLAVGPRPLTAIKIRRLLPITLRPTKISLHPQPISKR
jgi:hypothetical protein